MSKTITKVIAALGVVAGLGVAALPLSSYAAPLTSTDDVLVTATVTGSFTAAVTTGALPIGEINAGDDTAVEQTDTITITDNTPGAHSVYMGTEYNATDTGEAIAALKSSTNNIPAVASVTPGTAGWSYAHNGSGTLTYVKPVMYSDATNTTGGTPITTTGALTGSQAVYTIAAKAAAGPTTPTGTYENTIVIYAAENV